MILKGIKLHAFALCNSGKSLRLKPFPNNFYQNSEFFEQILKPQSPTVIHDFEILHSYPTKSVLLQESINYRNIITRNEKFLAQMIYLIQEKS